MAADFQVAGERQGGSSSVLALSLRPLASPIDLGASSDERMTLDQGDGGRCGRFRIGHCQSEVIRLAGEARTGKLYNKQDPGTVAADVNQWLTRASCPYGLHGPQEWMRRSFTREPVSGT